MQNKHFYLVCFDIVQNKARYRAVKCLLKYGSRVQKSVFECLINDNQFVQMKAELEKTIKPEEDSVRYYHLCKNCAANVLISGLGVYLVDEDVIII